MGQVVATTSWGEKNGPLIGLFSPPCEVNITYIIGRCGREGNSLVYMGFSRKFLLVLCGSLQLA